MSRIKVYYKVEDDAVQPIILELDEVWDYVKSCLEGLTPDCSIKITPVEMTESKFSQLPEFEG